MDAKPRKSKGRHVRNKLHARQLPGLTKPGIYSDGGGLYVRVQISGSRSWLFIYTRNGRRREMGLGSLYDVTLARARERAAEAREQLLAGVDPMSARKAADVTIEVPAAPKITFGAFALDLVDSIGDGFKNPKSFQQWRNTLTTYAQSMFDVPIDAVTTEHVLAVLQPIWLKKAETASRLRGRIERVLDAAKAKGLRSGENPAALRGHLELLLPKRTQVRVKHHAALPFEQVAGFMAGLRSRPAMAARALEFTILTAARSGEVRGLTWAEIDVQAKLWTVPAKRMKAGVEHQVPLSDAALAVLAAARPEKYEDWHFVFPAPRGSSLSDMALSQLLKRMDHGEITVHGFRSTFRDWAGDKTDFGREEVEMALAHTIESAVERAYRRGRALEKRRILMDAWAAFCCGSLPE